MKKKPVWMLCLILALFGFYAAVGSIDAMEFNGMRVMSGEQLERMTEGLNRVGSPQNAETLIEFNGHAIPYDLSDNTFYVSQPLEDKEYAGTFTAAGDNCTVYLQQDDALEDKQSAIAEGHIFTLWFVMENDYIVSNLIFTGLPVVSIRTGEGSLTDGYGRGNIIVQNPDDDDVATMSIKESAMEVRTNYNSGTISFRLYKDDYDEERDLSLLGLGKQTSWKLYPVYRKDDSESREMVAFYIWNSICGDSTLQKGMEYAEIIVDGEYRGLYYLAPKVGKGYLDLGEDDRAYECEELLEDGTKVYDVVGDDDTPENRRALEEYESLWGTDKHDFTQIDMDNYINYNIYLQAACAIQNSMEEYFVIAYEEDGEYIYRMMPGRSKFVFGLYPPAIGWQSVTATENVIEDDGYLLMASQSEEIRLRIAERWRELRRNALSTDSLLQTAYLYEQRLVDSGYVMREKFEPGAYPVRCKELHDVIRERMEYLDGYYGSSTDFTELENYYVSIPGQETNPAEQITQKSDSYDNDFLPINILTRCDGWTKEISLYVSEGICYAFLPAYAEQTEMVYVFDDTEYKLILSGQVLTSGEPVQGIETDADYEFEIIDQEHTVLNYTMVFLQSQYLPAVFIDTQSGSMDYVDADQGNAESGQFSCITAGGEIDSQSDMSRIKGRGNTSWAGIDGKNQYNVQLADSTDVLHMGSARNWIIQANRLDASMMRNKLAYDFAKDIGVPYAVDSEFADMYINGRYMGTYLVCEKVEVAPNRMDIGRGYLLEVNFREADEEPSFTTSGGTFIINNPNSASEEEVNYIADYVIKADDCITEDERSDEYLKYIDLNSFAKLYIMDEIGNDPDNNALSTFYYKDDADDARLTAGPVWDFDRAFGNDERNSEVLCSYYGEGWFKYLYRNEAFRDKVAEQLRSIMDNYYDKYANDYFENMKEYLRASYHMNEIRWKEKHGYIADYYSGCEDNIDYLDEYFMTRLNRLNQVFNGTNAMHKVGFVRRGHQYAHVFVPDGETVPEQVLEHLQMINGVVNWKLPNEQIIDPRMYAIYGDTELVQILQEEETETLPAAQEEDTGLPDVEPDDSERDLAMQWISFIMLMVPGLISVWISGNTKMSKENAFAILSQYFLSSFIVLLLAYAIFFVLYGSALLSFSGVYNAAYDYSIFNVNVAFKYLLLTGVLSTIVGIAERIIFTIIRKRQVTEK